MDWVQALILGVVQGITEFLPISSSGHLVLGEEFLGLEVADLKAFDVFVHVGTLAAILVYFWRDVWGLILGLVRVVSGRIKRDDPYVRLIGYLVVGTVPAGLLGVFAGDWIESVFRDVRAVASMMIIVGVVFFAAESRYRCFGKQVKDVASGMTWWRALLIGCVQAVALIPGVSRSGSTIATGLFFGIEREAAARFSFLLGIPAIAGAGLLTAIKDMEDIAIEWLPMTVGFAAAFISGVISVFFLMKFLKRHTLAVFAIYLLLLGIFVLIQ